jgi:hypothetical protein
MTGVTLAGSTGIGLSEKRESGPWGCRPMRISPRKRERAAQKSKTGKTCPRSGTRAQTWSEDRAVGSEPEADHEVQARAHVLLADASAHQREQKNHLRHNWEKGSVLMRTRAWHSTANKGIALLERIGLGKQSDWGDWLSRRRNK